jgi:hypothetical protein
MLDLEAIENTFSGRVGITINSFRYTQIRSNIHHIRL